MGFLSSLLPALIILGLLIIIHEFGHFLACRLSGVKVEKFSIGFGPEILNWQSKNTRYVISLLPLGGFVKPAGETVSETDPSGPKPGDYLAAPLLSRIFIVAAGVFMNYILAFVLFAAIFLMGRPVPGTVIGGFVKGYPAETSGLQAGDRVLALNGRPVETWKDLTDLIEISPEGPLEIALERGSEKLALQILPKVESGKDLFGHPVQAKRLGIMPDPKANKFERYGIKGALGAAWETEVFLTVMTHKAVFFMLMGKLSLKSLSGPIGIVTMTGSAVHLGLPYILQLAATLSISLAVINLLPVPALDGGHLLFLLIEAVRRKRVSLEFQERATQVGFCLLLTLMAFIIYNDLMNVNAFDRVRELVSKVAGH